MFSYMLLPGRPVRAGTADVGERRVDHPRPEPRLWLELQTNLREDQSFIYNHREGHYQDTMLNWCSAMVSRCEIGSLMEKS